MTMDTLAKGGTVERQVPIDHVKIPDVYALIKSLESRRHIMGLEVTALQELWSIAHSLKRHIQDEAKAGEPTHAVGE